jgi:hypothetical protein
MVRAYLFHFWLESASNNNLKTTVMSQTSQNLAGKKRKVMESPVDAARRNTPVHNQVHALSILPTKVQRSMLKAAPKPCVNGLQSIAASRRLFCEARPIDDNVIRTSSTRQTTDSTTNPTSDLTTMTKPTKHISWKSFRHISFEEMNRFVQSFLIIRRLDGVGVVAELSPLEVYSANHLHDLIHCRVSGKAPFYPPREKLGPVTLQIQKEADYFIDQTAKSFHVAREQSSYFLEHAPLLPSIQAIQWLCEMIVCHGSIDTKRAIGQYRLNIGNGGQNWVNGAPCKLHGLQFLKDIQEQHGNVDTILHTIGCITEFTWRVICALQQDAHDHPIAPDPHCKKLYAEHLNELLSIDAEVGFEDITLVVSSLQPVIHDVLDHKDIMNDTVAGYTRTAAFNMVMIDDNDRLPTILHLQVLCNF